MKMIRKNKNIMSFILCITILFGSILTFHADEIKSKSKEQIIYIEVGKGQNICISRPHKNIQWTSSNKKIAYISKITNRNAYIIAKKAGTVKIKAKVGKKTIAYCKVIVKKNKKKTSTTSKPTQVPNPISTNRSIAPVATAFAPVATAFVPTTPTQTAFVPATTAATSLTPTTAVPATMAPTTAVPVTTAPTTLAPTTLAPATAVPATTAPTTLAPATPTPAPTTVMAKLAISSDGKTVVRITNPEIATNVSIPAGITNIDKNVFYECKKITTVEIAEGVTDIGDYAFYDCENLKKLILPSTIINIGEHAFDRCYALENITIPNKTKTIGASAFGACISMTQCIIPNGVESIGVLAFYGCNSLKKISVPASIQNIGLLAFERCYVTEANLTNESNFDLTTYGLKLFDTEKDGLCLKGTVLVNYRNSYVGWEDTVDLVIPNTVTKIDNYAFCRCLSLRNVTIPGSVKHIGSCAFWTCAYLRDVNIQSGVESIGENAFEGNTYANTITIPNSVTSIGNNAFGNIPHIIYNGTSNGAPWGANAIN